MRYTVTFTITYRTEVEVRSKEEIAKAISDSIFESDLPEFHENVVSDIMVVVPEVIEDSLKVTESVMVVPYIECTVPEWALCYVFNGDDSSLSNEDKESVDSFLNKLPENGSFSLDLSSDPYFSRSNDINDMGSNVVDIRYYYHED